MKRTDEDGGMKSTVSKKLTAVFFHPAVLLA
jgi:hypothetical protein